MRRPKELMISLTPTASVKVKEIMVVDFNGLKVAVDQMSSMYLDGVEIDYIETIEGAGFKFNNPNVKSTCGCGSSFSV
jgi:iron-sulfur cluster assembly accessory protein